MDLTGLVVRSIAGAGLLTLVGVSVATAIPSFERSTRVSVGTGEGGFHLITGEFVPEVGYDLKPPKTLTKLVVKLPAGTSYTPKGTPACSEDKLVSEGCPKGSRVGVSVTHLIIPPPDPRAGTGSPCWMRGRIYNGGRGFLMTSWPRESCLPLDRDAIWLFDARIAKKRPVITIDVPDGPVNFFVMTDMSHKLLHPPGRCPRSGRWRTRVTAHYDDDTKESVVKRQRCRRPAR